MIKKDLNCKECMYHFHSQLWMETPYLDLRNTNTQSSKQYSNKTLDFQVTSIVLNPLLCVTAHCLTALRVSLQHGVTCYCTTKVGVAPQNSSVNSGKLHLSEQMRGRISNPWRSANGTFQVNRISDTRPGGGTSTLNVFWRNYHESAAFFLQLNKRVT